MADDKESPVHNMEENTLGNPPVGQVGSSAAASGADSVPMQMKLLSTWEVRKMPPNCVCRYSNNLAKKKKGGMLGGHNRATSNLPHRATVKYNFMSGHIHINYYNFSSLDQLQAFFLTQ